MSGVVLDVPAVDSITPRSFWRILLAVVLGVIGAGITRSLIALVLVNQGFLSARPLSRLAPFPVDGVWSLAADVVVFAFVVLYTAWWIRRLVEGAVRGHVSLGVVALAVVVAGYVPGLILRPPLLAAVVSVLAMTWIIRRYAIGTTLPFPKPSWRVWLALAFVGLAFVGSYRVYQPLTGSDDVTNASTLGYGKQFREITLKNAGWANLTIVRVDGGWVGRFEGLIAPVKLPYTVPSRGRVPIYVVGRVCAPRDVTVTFSVLGRTSSQRFPVPLADISPGLHYSSDVITPC